MFDKSIDNIRWKTVPNFWSCTAENAICEVSLYTFRNCETKLLANRLLIIIVIDCVILGPFYDNVGLEVCVFLCLFSKNEPTS